MALGILRRLSRVLCVPALSSLRRVLAFGWLVSINEVLSSRSKTEATDSRLQNSSTSKPIWLSETCVQPELKRGVSLEADFLN